jgi:hypothetical protein
MNIEAILQRLDKLYSDLPIEYAVYVLDAIEDIERIAYESKD